MQGPNRIFCVIAVTIVSSVFEYANGIELEHVDNNSEHIHFRKQAKNLNIIPGENDKAFWDEVGKEILYIKLNSIQQYGVAKNVIFFIGDGMSVTTLAAARIYMGQLQNKTGENEALSFEKFPYTGLSKTYCVDSQVADSACSATAYLSGVKGNIETIGVTGAVSNRDCLASNVPANRVLSSMAWAQRAGKRTGVVTNMRVTHATPAGAYASIAQRDWESDEDVARDPLADPRCLKESSDIARQLIEGDVGKNLNVIMGGGANKFLPNGTQDQHQNHGERLDGRNLIQEWLNINRPSEKFSTFVGNRSQLMSLNTSQTDYLMGLFASSHMNFTLLANKSVEPTLMEMTEAAIKVLSKGDNGYYLFVEGGLIDWAHHGNGAHLALDETVMLSKTVQRALEMTSRDDTLIVVSSDHSHVMTMSGYPNRGSNILGHPGVSSYDHMPYSTLSYANGPSWKPSNSTTGMRYNLTNDNTDDVLYQFPAMVPSKWETHGGDDVGVFALGPWAHLFVGSYEQNFIPYAISFAANMGPGAGFDRPDAKDKSPVVTKSSATKDSMAFGTLVSIVSCTLVFLQLR